MTDELAKLIKGLLRIYDEDTVYRAINDCHMGRLDGWIIRQDTMHLVRHYRNYISADPEQLLQEAIAWNANQYELQLD